MLSTHQFTSEGNLRNQEPLWNPGSFSLLVCEMFPLT